MARIVFGIFVILGIFIDEAINIVILLLLFFLAMLFGAYFQGLDISCGCTSDNGSSLEDAIIKDFILLFACLYIKFRGFIRNRYV